MWLILVVRVLPLTCLSTNDADGMLGDVVDSSGVAFFTYEDFPFSLDVYNITLLVVWHGSGQRNTSMFPKRAVSRQQAPLLSLYIYYFGELREDGCCGLFLFFTCLIYLCVCADEPQYTRESTKTTIELVLSFHHGSSRHWS